MLIPAILMMASLLGFSINSFADETPPTIADICPNYSGQWKKCEKISGPEGAESFSINLRRVWQDVQDGKMIYHFHFPMEGEADIEWFFIVDRQKHRIQDGGSEIEYRASCRKTTSVWDQELFIESEAFLAMGEKRVSVGKRTQRFSVGENHELQIETKQKLSGGVEEKVVIGCSR